MAETYLRSGGVQPDQVDALAAILAFLHKEGASTRPEIGRRLGLGRTVVSQRLEQAVGLGLLVGAELGPSTGGRAPRVVRFDAAMGQLLVGAFGGTHASIGVCDLRGRVVDSTSMEWDITRGPGATLSFVAAQFERLLINRQDAPVWGIGLGLPGPVEFRTARLVAPPIMPDWDGFDIRGVLQPRFDAPVWVDNDVNLLALAEYTEEERSERAPFVYVKVGTGIGAAIIAGGHLHRGANGGAGGIGHLRVPNHDSQVCLCGRVGCLAAVAGGWALVRDAGSRAAESPFLAARREQNGKLAVPDVIDGLRHGDTVCTELITRSGRTVGEQIAAMISFFNPARVAIGGSVGAAGDLFMSSVREVVYRQSIPLATRDLRITQASHRPQDALRGAATLLVDQLFTADAARKWISTGRPATAGTEGAPSPNAPAATPMTVR